jgi:hypothetical protein
MLHGNKGAIAFLPQLIDGDDIGSGQLSGGSSLTKEASSKLIIHFSIGIQDFDSDVAFKRWVVSFVDNPYRSSAYLTLDPVSSYLVFTHGYPKNESGMVVILSRQSER